MEVVSRMGRKVWLLDQQSKKWSIKGVIKSIRIDGRSYVGETSNGVANLRKGRFIKAAVCRVNQ